MKISSVTFVTAVRVPGRTPSMELVARTAKGVEIEYGGGLVRVSFTDQTGTRAIAVPGGNVAYMELAAEPAEAPAKK